MQTEKKLNILISSGHPAQIHNFRELKKELEAKGHTVFWVATQKDISEYLLHYYGIRYTVLRRPRKSIFSRIYTLIINSITVFSLLKNNNIDIAVSRVSPYVTIACMLRRTEHIALTDTETAGIYDKIFGTFATTLLTAKSFRRQLRKDQIRFDGNIELFYLHPKRFQPANNVENILGLHDGEPYVIMRFVTWDAYHDKGIYGFTDENKIKAVEEISKYARVFVSSENKLQKRLEKYRITIPVEKMHDVIAHATLFFGESATMASESAIMGTPAIYLNKNWLGYIEEAAKYDLVHLFKDSLEKQNSAINKAEELLKDPNIKEKTLENASKFLKDKIDVTAFMVWFIENIPESIKIMKENPEYQYNFK